MNDLSFIEYVTIIGIALLSSVISYFIEKKYLKSNRYFGIINRIITVVLMILIIIILKIIGYFE